MILERFDAIVFIGDDTLKSIYAGFNILRRENMAMGALKQWEMSDEDMQSCRCENQFIKGGCSKYIISGSQNLRENDHKTEHQSPYVCQSKSTQAIKYIILRVDFAKESLTSSYQSPTPPLLKMFARHSIPSSPKI